VTQLSRRDRAALALALECLRAGDDYDASSALFAGAHEETCSAIRLAFLDAGFSTPNRVLCARLALALRVLLRADAGDFGARERWLQCQRCWRIERDLDSEAARQGVCVPFPRSGLDCPGNSHAPAYLLPMQWPLPPYRAVRPLWERAKRHEP
jgi:hypothetical protein